MQSPQLDVHLSAAALLVLLDQSPHFGCDVHPRLPFRPASLMLSDGANGGFALAACFSQLLHQMRIDAFQPFDLGLALHHRIESCVPHPPFQRCLRHGVPHPPFQRCLRHGVVVLQASLFGPRRGVVDVFPSVFSVPSGAFHFFVLFDMARKKKDGAPDWKTIGVFVRPSQ